MASKESGRIIGAYEKMLENGDAFKRIDMQKIQNQQYAQAGMGGTVDDIRSEQSNPLGKNVRESQLEDDHTDFSSVDKAMQRRINALKEKMNPKPVSTGGTEEIIKLKKRVKQLEEAVMLLMKTQEKLLG